MTSILSFSEILKGKFKNRKDKSGYFAEIIHEESQRLTRLLDEILNLSFLESGQTKSNHSEILFSELIRRALIATNALIENRKVTVHPSKTDFVFVSDEDRLVQAVINLITNAIKHNTSDAPQVWINARISHEQNEVQIDIRDNGPGISDDQIDEIFEKFKTTNTDNRYGVGLGLPISAQIIKILGGTISVSSDADGSTFSIRLPAFAEDQYKDKE